MLNGKAIKEALELIARAVSSGTRTRQELLTHASQMASAIQMASALCTSRLARALAAATMQDKQQILANLGQHEILQMGQMNNLCSAIAASANHLNHALSAEWANVNLGSHALAREVFTKLQDAERGLQQLFTASIGDPPAGDMDTWIKEKSREFSEIGAAATAAVSAITRAI